MTETVWICEQMRAGEVYASQLFHSKEDAEEFAKKMRDAVPDQFFRIEAVPAQQVWN